MDLIKFRKQLENDDVNIFDLDLKEIEELSSMLPRYGVIDMNVAEELATQFLRAADILSDIFGLSLSWEGRMMAQKQRAWGEAFYIKATSSGIKTAKEKEAFADSNDEFIKWSNKATDAQAFRKYIETKYQTFIKAHHLAKSVWETSTKQEQYGGAVISGARIKRTRIDFDKAEEKKIEEKTYGEEEW